MKVWNGYGSEHSMNLVMIGHFKEVRDAKKTKKLMDQFIEKVREEPENSLSGTTDEQRFSEPMMELMRKSKIHTLGPIELDQFNYDVNVRLDGSTVVVTTEEVDVSAFLKLMLNEGARIEVYSAHNYPAGGHGRGR